jgi:peptide/nickel transport system permease protein
MVGVLIYIIFIFIAIFAPLIAPYDPFMMIKENGKLMFNQPPSSKYLLGTTNMGRDIFSQLIYGSRPALIVGFTAAIFVMIIGTMV